MDFNRKAHRGIYWSLFIIFVISILILIVITCIFDKNVLGLFYYNYELNKSIVNVTFYTIIVFILLKYDWLHPLKRLSIDTQNSSVSSNYFIDANYDGKDEFYVLNSSDKNISNHSTKSSDLAEKLDVPLNAIENILNGMDAYLYVTDPDTDEILFINDKMREHYNLDNTIVGQICWKVLQSGFTKRCAFCPLHQLDKGIKKIIWEEHSTVTNRYYKNIDTMIEWTNGKLVHLQHSSDITDHKQAEAILERRLDQQRLMADLSQNFISGGDVDPMIMNALQMTGQFMDISRIMLVKYENQSLLYQYEWCNPRANIKSKRGTSLQLFDMEAQIATAFKLRLITHYNLDDNKNKNKIIQEYGIDVKTSLFLPVFLGNELWGALEFDQCEQNIPWSSSDINLGMMVAGILSGVIKRQSIEEKLLRMSSIVDSSPQYIAYSNWNGKFEFFSPSTMEITGYSHEELMDGGLSLLYDELILEQINQEINPIILEKGKHEFVLPLICKDGQKRIMAFSAFVIPGDNSGCGTIATDITFRMQLEKQLIEAKDVAEQASRAKGEFLSRMSHEMRTPMNAIIGMTTIAKNTKDLEKKEYCLDKIRNASRHLLGVINDVLDMSKIEANKFELSYSEFDIEKLIMNITNIVNFKAEEKRQDLIINLDKNVPLFVIGDEIRLTQIITNLLTNAIKFTPDNGTIMMNLKVVSESEEIATIQFEVIDNGIGISKEQQSRLFTSFEQADGSIARKFGGTGLGLAISKHIVELMGGDIWIDSEIGKGSKFIFTIQVKKGTSEHLAKLSPRIDRKNLNILAVDDSSDIRDYFASVMSSLGLPCSVASSGKEALSMIENSKDKPFNIFFIDYIMPEMNGVELSRKIKEIKSDNAIIIMISTTEWNEIEQEAIASGVSHFISKPLFPSALLDIINESLVPDYKDNSGLKTVLSTQHYKNHSILLVEDVDVNREIILDLLESTKIKIDIAENGKEAVRIFKENPDKYSLIFMDIHMPEMNGYDATKNIRALDFESAKQIPIIAMTANVFKEDIDMCMNVGMNDHISKPIDSEVLFQKISNYLKTKKSMSKKTNHVEKVNEMKENIIEDYSVFLPDIDVAASISRLMNNKKLYLTLLKNFKGRQMADEIIKSIQEADHQQIMQKAHALKGVCANLGMITLQKITLDIESHAKVEMDCTEYIKPLDELIDNVSDMIKKLLES